MSELFINGQWVTGRGAVLERQDPAEGKLTWKGRTANAEDVDRAVVAAQTAGAAWAGLSVDRRAEFLEAFGRQLVLQEDALLEAICLETGKPRWEARTELEALSGKIELTKKAAAQRRNAVAVTKDGVASATRYIPLGPVAVLGPFNLPAHLPNGQILPALLAGNTVVFKPSELTPRVGEIYARCWENVQLPAGVFNLLQGGRDTGAALAGHLGIRGVFFTGSYAGGVALSKLLAGHPEKMLALEMGGSNPLVAWDVSNLDAAAYAIVQSAFLTAGQRCTCARRLIVPQGADPLLERLVRLAKGLVVGPFTRVPEPFMGPVISDAAAQQLLYAKDDLLARGARPLLEMHSIGPRLAMLSPGILDVTAVTERQDEELFGPLLQVIRVPDFQAALEEANRTQFGLAAGLLSDDPALYERFLGQVRAGVINWNRPTTGASGSLPFGGVGASGNHRPAGFFAIDFCCDPVTSLESPTLVLPANLSPGISL